MENNCIEVPSDRPPERSSLQTSILETYNMTEEFVDHEAFWCHANGIITEPPISAENSSITVSAPVKLSTFTEWQSKTLRGLAKPYRPQSLAGLSNNSLMLIRLKA
jgi:hypothetical protein